MSIFLVGHATLADKLKLTTSAAADVDVHCSYIDYSDADPPVVTEMNSQSTTITSATTTDILTGVADAAKRRVVKQIAIVNTHASTSTNVSVILDDIDTADYQIAETVSLAPGESFKYEEGLGWFKSATTAKLNAYRYVDADYVNATTSFSDITGLTCPVLSGKNYNFLCHLYHFANATTSGPRFAVNGPAMTGMRLGAIITEAGGVAAAIMNGNVGDVTALETAVAATTDSTTTMVLSIMSGWINPSASGTFAVRGASEVAVAAGLTVKKGSFLHIWETPAG